jgi:hypothetical protein
MIFKFKMTSTKNMFSILGSYGPELSPHIVFLLKTSGYVSFRALSKITAEKILDIEKFIRTLFSGKTLTEELSKEDRISQFGPFPASNFTLPGRTVCVRKGRWDIPSVRPESVRGTSKCRSQGCPTVDSQWTSPKDIVGKENFGD